MAAALRHDGGLLFFLLQLIEPCAKNAHGLGFVFDLRFLVLLRDDEAGRNVREAHRGISCVHGLPAGAGRAEGIDAQILWLNFDVDFVGFRQNRDGGRGSMDAALLLGGGHTLDAMDAAFILQLGIDFVALNRGDDFFHATERGWRAFQHFDFPALRFRVTRIHAEKFSSEERGLIAACSGANFQQNVFLVVRILWKEKQFQFALDRFLARGELLFFFVSQLLHFRVVGFNDHLMRSRQVLFDLLVFAVLGDDFFELGVLLGELLEARRIGHGLRSRELLRQLVVARLQLIQFFS